MAKAVRLPAIGSSDFFRHGFARQLRNGAGGGNLHRIIDRRRADIERAAKDEGEAKDIIDLIGIIRPARRHNRIRPRGLCIGRGDFRIRIGHGKDDWRRCHFHHHMGFQRAGGGQAKENVRTL